MSAVRGLTVILTGADSERFHSALSIAAAHIACGGPARIFFESRAVLLLTAKTAPGDEARAASGLPTLAELRAEASALGVAFVACQGGMGLTGLAIEQLGPGVEAGGLVGLMASLGDDRLVTI